jgi:phage baseplate assembly protein W
MSRARTVNDTIASSIRAFLLTRPGQRRYNPIGSFLSDLKHKLISKTDYQVINDELRKELINNFAGVTFTQVEVVQLIEDNTITLKVNIQFSTPISDISEIQLLF